MRILLIGAESRENQDIIIAARKYNHRIFHVSICDIVVHITKTRTRLLVHGRALPKVDVCLIRGVVPYLDHAKTVAKYLADQNVVVIDRELHKKVYQFDKVFLYTELTKMGIPCPETWYFPRRSLLTPAHEKSLKYPLLVKDLHGMRSRNIFLVKNRAALRSCLLHHEIKSYFLQQNINADYVLRILVIGTTVVGAMQRMSLMHPNRREIRRRDRSMTTTLTPALRTLAIRATRAVNADIGGVDVMVDGNGRPYVLEVNRAPNFRGIARVCQLDVAGMIITYLEQVYAQQTKTRIPRT